MHYHELDLRPRTLAEQSRAASRAQCWAGLKLGAWLLAVFVGLGLFLFL